MHGNSLTYSSFLKGEPLSSVLSSDGNFNFCIRSSPLRAGAAYNNSKPKQKEGKYTLQLTLAFHSFPPDTHSCLFETMSPNCLASCTSFFLTHDAGGFSGADWASIAKNFVTHVSQWWHGHAQRGLDVWEALVSRFLLCLASQRRASLVWVESSQTAIEPFVCACVHAPFQLQSSRLWRLSLMFV